jgi:hypothetical protein
MEASGYRHMADRLAELIDAGQAMTPKRACRPAETCSRGSFGKKPSTRFPTKYVDEGWLVGPVQRIRQRVNPWFDGGLTGLIVRYGPLLTYDATSRTSTSSRLSLAAGRELFARGSQ